MFFKISTFGYAKHINFDNSTCFNIVSVIKFSLLAITSNKEKSKSVFSLIVTFFLLKKTKLVSNQLNQNLKLTNLFKSYLFFSQKFYLGNFVSFLTINSKRGNIGKNHRNIASIVPRNNGFKDKPDRG